ncbi:MFS transporter [Gudongella sp. DL1XJH-153]|uniref:MFS transporter n=1 Tax=Gudongella sp. DL1XJH-153 TaxID=3409804 RepID=UPI003BB5A6CD
MNKFLNISYGAVQGFYWMYFAVIISFASAFLLDRGYSNSQIGFILAFANILAVLIQPILADIADRSKKLSLVSVLGVMGAGLIIGTGSLYFMDYKSILLTSVFVLTGALQISLQPLINSIAFHFSKAGSYINFGATRSVGSVAYAFISSILGFLVLRFGTRTIPLTGVVVIMLLMTALFLTDKLFKKNLTLHIPDQSLDDSKEDATITLLQFMKRNKIFVVLTFGIMLVFFQNAVINNFLIQILRNIGGDSSQMGRLFSFMALLEMPGLFFFSKLRTKFRSQTMLKISSIAFIGKVFFTYLAPSVGFVYLAFLFQLISFPLFLSSAVHLADEVMEKGEAVKGQSLVTGMMTLSGVFASLLGGAVLDIGGPSQLLLISTGLAVVGTFSIFLTVNKV